MSFEPDKMNISMLPDVGKDDWDYAFGAALVRSMETSLLSPAVFSDMAGAADLSSAAEMLSGSEYAFSQGKVALWEVETMLVEKRRELRDFFIDLLADNPVAAIPAMMADMSNLRLALRRFVTERPIGEDYYDGGSQPVGVFEDMFENNEYSFLPQYMKNAIETALPAYYQEKDVRAIDYAVDQAQFDALIDIAKRANCPYLDGLARVDADLINIKAVMRKKLRDTDSLEGLISGGFVSVDKLKSALLQPQEQFANICFATPYGSLIDSGIEYLQKNNSFAGFEALCDKHMEDCYGLASQITAGIQPIIAYYYKKSDQIRKVRMVLTAKRSLLDKKIIIDRLGA